jgi:hypothetical protein
MAESAFLAAVQSYLAERSLAPEPESLGLAEPAASGDLPAIVLSLETSARRAIGIGERVATIEGALAHEASISLAAPVLETDPSFTLLSEDRLTLILPHGGLVRADGSAGTLGEDDLSVRVGNTVRPVVGGPPSGAQVSCDPQVGRLTFATALPATGRVRARYFIGRWERRVALIEGVLRLDVCAASADDVQALSDGAVAALLAEDARASIERLLSIECRALSSIGPIEAGFGNARRRSARLAFRFEQLIDQPESSGGIIAQIPVTTRLIQGEPS